jgi:hypothetical protein
MRTGFKHQMTPDDAVGAWMDVLQEQGLLQAFIDFKQRKDIEGFTLHGVFFKMNQITIFNFLAWYEQQQLPQLENADFEIQDIDYELVS